MADEVISISDSDEEAVPHASTSKSSHASNTSTTKQQQQHPPGSISTPSTSSISGSRLSSAMLNLDLNTQSSFDSTFVPTIYKPLGADLLAARQKQAMSKKKLSIAQPFPVVRSVVYKLRSSIGTKDSQTNILALAQEYIRSLKHYQEQGIGTCPNRCRLLARHIIHTLCSLRDLSRPYFQSPHYSQKICEILAMYIYFELRSAGDFKVPKVRIAERIINNIHLHLENAQSNFFLRIFAFLNNMCKENEIATKLFQRLIPEPIVLIKNEFPDRLYIQYLIVFYHWKETWNDFEDQQKIIAFANKFMKPMHTIKANKLYAKHLPSYVRRDDATGYFLQNLVFFNDLRNASILDGIEDNGPPLVDLSEEDRDLPNVDLSQVVMEPIQGLVRPVKVEPKELDGTVDLTDDDEDTWLQKLIRRAVELEVTLPARLLPTNDSSSSIIEVHDSDDELTCNNEDEWAFGSVRREQQKTLEEGQQQQQQEKQLPQLPQPPQVEKELPVEVAAVRENLLTNEESQDSLDDIFVDLDSSFEFDMESSNGESDTRPKKDEKQTENSGKTTEIQARVSFSGVVEKELKTSMISSTPKRTEIATAVVPSTKVPSPPIEATVTTVVPPIGTSVDKSVSLNVESALSASPDNVETAITATTVTTPEINDNTAVTNTTSSTNSAGASKESIVDANMNGENSWLEKLVQRAVALEDTIPERPSRQNEATLHDSDNENSNDDDAWAFDERQEANQPSIEKKQQQQSSNVESTRHLQKTEATNVSMVPTSKSIEETTTIAQCASNEIIVDATKVISKPVERTEVLKTKASVKEMQPLVEPTATENTEEVTLFDSEIIREVSFTKTTAENICSQVTQSPRDAVTFTMDESLLSSWDSSDESDEEFLGRFQQPPFKTYLRKAHTKHTKKDSPKSPPSNANNVRASSEEDNTPRKVPPCDIVAENKQPTSPSKETAKENPNILFSGRVISLREDEASYGGGGSTPGYLRTPESVEVSKHGSNVVFSMQGRRLSSFPSLKVTSHDQKMPDFDTEIPITSEEDGNSNTTNNSLTETLVNKKTKNHSKSIISSKNQKKTASQGTDKKRTKAKSVWFAENTQVREFESRKSTPPPTKSSTINTITSTINKISASKQHFFSQSTFMPSTSSSSIKPTFNLNDPSKPPKPNYLIQNRSNPITTESSAITAALKSAQEKGMQNFNTLSKNNNNNNNTSPITNENLSVFNDNANIKINENSSSRENISLPHPNTTSTNFNSNSNSNSNSYTNEKTIVEHNFDNDNVDSVDKQCTPHFSGSSNILETEQNNSFCDDSNPHSPLTASIVSVVSEIVKQTIESSDEDIHNDDVLGASEIAISEGSLPFSTKNVISDKLVFVTTETPSKTFSDLPTLNTESTITNSSKCIESASELPMCSEKTQQTPIASESALENDELTISPEKLHVEAKTEIKKSPGKPKLDKEIESSLENEELCEKLHVDTETDSASENEELKILSEKLQIESESENDDLKVSEKLEVETETASENEEYKTLVGKSQVDTKTETALENKERTLSSEKLQDDSETKIVLENEELLTSEKLQIEAETETKLENEEPKTSTEKVQTVHETESMSENEELKISEVESELMSENVELEKLQVDTETEPMIENEELKISEKLQTEVETAVMPENVEFEISFEKLHVETETKSISRNKEHIFSPEKVQVDADSTSGYKKLKLSSEKLQETDSMLNTELPSDKLQVDAETKPVSERLSSGKPQIDAETKEKLPTTPDTSTLIDTKTESEVLSEQPPKENNVINPFIEYSVGDKENDALLSNLDDIVDDDDDDDDLEDEVILSDISARNSPNSEDEDQDEDEENKIKVCENERPFQFFLKEHLTENTDPKPSITDLGVETPKNLDFQNKLPKTNTQKSFEIPDEIEFVDTQSPMINLNEKSLESEVAIAFPTNGSDKNTFIRSENDNSILENPIEIISSIEEYPNREENTLIPTDNRVDSPLEFGVPNEFPSTKNPMLSHGQKSDLKNPIEIEVPNDFCKKRTSMLSPGDSECSLSLLEQIDKLLTPMHRSDSVDEFELFRAFSPSNAKRILGEAGGQIPLPLKKRRKLSEFSEENIQCKEEDDCNEAIDLDGALNLKILQKPKQQSQQQQQTLLPCPIVAKNNANIHLEQEQKEISYPSEPMLSIAHFEEDEYKEISKEFNSNKRQQYHPSTAPPKYSDIVRDFQPIVAHQQTQFRPPELQQQVPQVQRPAPPPVPQIPTVQTINIGYPIQNPFMSTNISNKTPAFPTTTIRIDSVPGGSTNSLYTGTQPVNLTNVNMDYNGHPHPIQITQTLCNNQGCMYMQRPPPTPTPEHITKDFDIHSLLNLQNYDLNTTYLSNFLHNRQFNYQAARSLMNDTCCSQSGCFQRNDNVHLLKNHSMSGSHQCIEHSHPRSTIPKCGLCPDCKAVVAEMIATQNTDHVPHSSRSNSSAAQQQQQHEQQTQQELNRYSQSVQQQNSPNLPKKRGRPRKMPIPSLPTNRVTRSTIRANQANQTNQVNHKKKEETQNDYFTSNVSEQPNKTSPPSAKKRKHNPKPK